MTSRPTCVPICRRSILSRSPLPPNAGSRSSRRTTLSSRLTVQISPPSSVLGSYYAKVGWRVYFDPRCPSVHSRTRGLPQLSTFLYTKRIDHLLATCCLSQHLQPSTLRTPRARACALSCSNLLRAHRSTLRRLHFTTGKRVDRGELPKTSKADSLGQRTRAFEREFVGSLKSQL